MWRGTGPAGLRSQLWGRGGLARPWIQLSKHLSFFPVHLGPRKFRYSYRTEPFMVTISLKLHRNPLRRVLQSLPKEQRGKLRQREAKRPAQGHTVGSGRAEFKSQLS